MGERAVSGGVGRVFCGVRGSGSGDAGSGRGIGDQAVYR